jgi:hypothetical protein
MLFSLSTVHEAGGLPALIPTLETNAKDITRNSSRPLPLYQQKQQRSTLIRRQHGSSFRRPQRPLPWLHVISGATL